MSVLAVATVGTLLAQRPVDGANPFSLEGEVSMNALNNTFSAPAIRFRYFIGDNISLRLGVTYNGMTEKENFYGSVATPANYGDSIGTWTTKTNAYFATIGAAYHFSQLEKLSPYAGIDFAIGGGSAREMGANTNGGAWVNDFSYSSKSPMMMFGGRIVAGFDWYFSQNVFLGAELGWGVMATSWKDETVSVTTAGTTTEVTTPVMGSPYSSLQMGNTFIAGIRLGWRF